MDQRQPSDQLEKPSSCVRTSGLNSVNSRPRQSNTSTFCALDTSECSYGTAPADIVADDSLCSPHRLSTSAAGYGSRRGPGPSTCLAVLALPHEVGLSPAAAHLVCLLRRWPPLSIGRPACATEERSSYKTADADPVGVCLSARCALHLERVPERALLRVVWPEVRDPAVALSVRVSRGSTEQQARREAFSSYPANSAVNVSAYMRTPWRAAAHRTRTHSGSSSVTRSISLGASSLSFTRGWTSKGAGTGRGSSAGRCMYGVLVLGTTRGIPAIMTAPRRSADEIPPFLRPRQFLEARSTTTTAHPHRQPQRLRPVMPRRCRHYGRELLPRHTRAAAGPAFAPRRALRSAARPPKRRPGRSPSARSSPPATRP